MRHLISCKPLQNLSFYPRLLIRNLSLLLLLPAACLFAAPGLAETFPDEADEACGAVKVGDFDLPARDADGEYLPGTASFAVQVLDEVIPYTLMSIFVQPGQEVEIEAVFGARDSRFETCAQGGTLKRQAKDTWTWRAPKERGRVMLHVSDLTRGETIVLQAFVLDPYKGQDSMNGYNIGSYEKIPLRNNPAYAVPKGMLRVEPDMLDLWLSPHFQLRQFLCKQKSSFPKYVIVRTRMLLKLELLLEKVNEGGIDSLTFAVLSGFRTPAYNASIGNRTKYSRHTYGDAADIYVDRDNDGRLDDLNGDGKSDFRDAKVLAKVIEDNREATWYQPFIGGLGVYGPKPHRGGFIHVDTRGHRARWQNP